MFLPVQRWGDALEPVSLHRSTFVSGAGGSALVVCRHGGRGVVPAACRLAGVLPAAAGVDALGAPRRFSGARYRAGGLRPGGGTASDRPRGGARRPPPAAFPP